MSFCERICLGPLRVTGVSVRAAIRHESSDGEVCALPVPGYIPSSSGEKQQFDCSSLAAFLWEYVSGYMSARPWGQTQTKLLILISHAAFMEKP